MNAAAPQEPVPPASFEFELAIELEARVPPEARGLKRDEVRLLVSHRGDDRVIHGTFLDLPWFLDAGDLIVVNDSATIPAALRAHLPDGAPIALHLSTRLDATTWVVEPRGDAEAVEPGAVLRLPSGGAVQLLHPHRGSVRLWDARLDLPTPVLRYLHEWGRPIAYRYAQGDWPLAAYQTAYARIPGSAEMPSAGRAFSARVLDALSRRGVLVEAITLHTGVASLEAHEAPYEERYDVPVRTARAVNDARGRGARVIAVGTTVVRALESAATPDGRVERRAGWTALVITPERGVRTVDALLTGFHEPQASHLQMLAAIAPVRHLQAAYQAALSHRYLWHEFGDLHLIL
jgi:S-adenosylmethionine:tRNA ribosyltransferase-isomerase